MGCPYLNPGYGDILLKEEAVAGEAALPGSLESWDALLYYKAHHHQSSRGSERQQPQNENLQSELGNMLPAGMLQSAHGSYLLNWLE